MLQVSDLDLAHLPSFGNGHNGEDHASAKSLVSSTVMRSGKGRSIRFKSSNHWLQL